MLRHSSDLINISQIIHLGSGSHLSHDYGRGWGLSFGSDLLPKHLKGCDYYYLLMMMDDYNKKLLLPSPT